MGAGIYFGDVWDTSAGYTGIGKDGMRYMLMVNVALGKIFDQKNIDGKIVSAPKGFFIDFFYRLFMIFSIFLVCLFLIYKGFII